MICGIRWMSSERLGESRIVRFGRGVLVEEKGS